ncbi:PREDICTED: uncharacterized protein LOC101631465 [Condylura cristata]|uniref:uncharacterized protein LOC101631465 n=1 Tax=Condylura cristata TaxID=143302 RepID=UPI0006434920|nr:PREDICTED: uncharacterized protein LOC101631465 [Condylura cristata]
MRLLRVSSEGEEKGAPKAQPCGLPKFKGREKKLMKIAALPRLSSFSGLPLDFFRFGGRLLVRARLSGLSGPGTLPLLVDDCRGQAPCLGLHPAVTEDLVDMQPPVDVRLEHAVDEVLALACQVLGAGEIDTVLLLDAQHLLDVGVIIGHGATDHDVEDHAQAPDVIHLGLEATPWAEADALPCGDVAAPELGKCQAPRSAPGM